MDTNDTPLNHGESHPQSSEISPISASCRGIRSYALRAGRMTPFQRASYESLAERWCVPFRPGETFDSVTAFGRSAPLVMEIGFGMGMATAEIAEALPDRNFLGLEVHTPGVGKLLSEIEKRDLKNIRILHHDAVEFLELCVAPNTVSGFHVFFPDPWPKKRHYKRRLIQRPLTDIMTSCLIPGGYIYFVTDWEDYALWAREVFENTPGLHNKTPGAWASRASWRAVTKFESRALSEGREIRELWLEK